MKLFFICAHQKVINIPPLEKSYRTNKLVITSWKVLSLYIWTTGSVGEMYFTMQREK